MSFRGSTGIALRDLLESQGESGSITVIRDILEKDEVSPYKFSLKETWEACIAFESSKNKSFLRSAQESVTSDLFPKITGEIINSAMIKAYNIPGLIGKKLCETVPSFNEIEKHAGWSALEGPDLVL